MPPNIPIEFLRRLANNVLQHAGNRVQLEDPNGTHYDAANPLPIQAPPGAILGTVGIDQITANANHVEDVPLNTVIGTKADSLTTDPAATASVVAILKGLLQAQGTKRSAGTAHRVAVTSIDKGVPLVTGDITSTTAATGGALEDSTTYKFTVVAGNRWGSVSVPAVINSQATAADAAHTHSVTIAWPQVAGMEFYDILFSVDAAPKVLARVTEAQRAAGDFRVLTMGTVTAGGGNAAGTILVGTVGTGQASSAQNFAQNNAYRPDNAAIISYDCTGKPRVHVLAKLALTDLRTAPSLSLVPFFANQLSAGDWAQGQAQTLNLLSAVGQSLIQDFYFDNVDGSPGLKILIGTIAGQGAAASVWIE